MASYFYLGSVDPSQALKALEGTYDGAFVVREDITNDQCLWLHYVQNNMVIQVAVLNGPNGLYVAGSSARFVCLSELIAWYGGDRGGEINSDSASYDAIPRLVLGWWSGFDDYGSQIF